jgi:hypothetical protein
MSLTARDDARGARHIVIGSNDQDVTNQLARALADGVLRDTVRVSFRGIPGHEGEPEDVQASLMADVVISPGRPDSTGDVDSTATGPAVGAIAAAPQGPDSCTCRIEGTIEVQWDQPLPERVPVALWLEDTPTTRDSVELLLGSPRAFQLQATTCGPHAIAYETYSRLRFRLRTPAPVVDCAGARLRQVRIVIEPASRLRPVR